MIIPEVKGLWFTVFVDEKLAIEYACLRQTSGTSDSESSNDIPTNRCYIESKTDSAYFIEYTVSRNFKLPKNALYLVLRLYVDGKFFTGKCVHRDMLKGENDYVNYISDRTATVIDGILYSENLVFQNLSSSEGSDHGTIDRDMERLRSMGEIRVEVSFAKETEAKEHRVSRRDNIHEPPLRLSHKARIKSDSGIRHGTCYKRIVKNTTPRLRGIKLESHHPAGVYRFYYRPYDALVSRGVIARDPRHICQPYPSSKASEVIDLTNEN